MPASDPGTPVKNRGLHINPLFTSVRNIISRVFTAGSTQFRITIGLVSILATLVLTADMLGLFPDRSSAIRDGRVAIAESIAVNTAAFITQKDLFRLRANLNLVVERNDDILSAAVKRSNENYVVEIGEHKQHWKVLKTSHSTSSQLQVPIWTGENKWGQVELRFTALKEPGLTGLLLSKPLVLFMCFLSIAGFIIFYFYLGKMLTQLNPSEAIPGRVRSTLDTIAGSLLVIDSRERVVLANQAFASLLCKSPDDLLGFKVSDFHWTSTNGEQLKSTESPWTEALRVGNPQMNTLMRLEIDESSRRTFMANCSPILGSGGNVGGVLISLDDVTELEEKEIQLRKSKAEADAANKSKSDFLANMSHEIRTPMNTILGFTQVLKRGYDHDSQDTAKYLNTIDSSGKHLLEIINDILDLSKVEAGNISVETIPCSPHQIIREMVMVLGLKAQEKGTRLTFETRGKIPETILSDPVRLRQIITNLVGNSIKFTKGGSIKVVARLVRKNSRPQLAIKVLDTGIGMTSEQAKGVFNAFEQANSTITRRFGGTGLGLSISKRFAEALGGDITVRSKPDKGSMFTLLIDTGPLIDVRMLKPDEIEKEQEEIYETRQQQWVFPPARILLVDDGAENCELVTLVLEEAGLSVDIAENGKTGSDKAIKGNYDLVLMDVSMPVMDGYAATRLLRKKGLTIPIVALTAHAMGDVKQKCLRAGYTGFLTKPVNIDGLVDAMAGYLGGYKKEISDSDLSNPSTLQTRQIERRGRNTVTPLNPELKSGLSIDNPRVHAMVKNFIQRLTAELNSMQKALDSNDFSELASLAHWLKGAGGTVGFDTFTTPAAALEQSAKARDDSRSRKLIVELQQIAGRLVSEIPVLTKATDYSGFGNETTNIIPVKLLSTVLSDHPRMRPIVEKFVVRLEGQIAALENAWKYKDYGELARLSHWLKGAGGTVGFDAFSEPAKYLETLAKEKDESRIEAALAVIRLLANRIYLPEEPGNTAIGVGNGSN